MSRPGLGLALLLSLVLCAACAAKAPKYDEQTGEYTDRAIHVAIIDMDHYNGNDGYDHRTYRDSTTTGTGVRYDNDLFVDVDDDLMLQGYMIVHDAKLQAQKAFYYPTDLANYSDDPLRAGTEDLSGVNYSAINFVSEDTLPVSIGERALEIGDKVAPLYGIKVLEARLSERHLRMIVYATAIEPGSEKAMLRQIDQRFAHHVKDLNP